MLKFNFYHNRKENFYSNKNDRETTGLIGYIRGDFGSGGNSFHHSWFENKGKLNNEVFKEDLNKVMEFLRERMLTDRQYMRSVVYGNPNAKIDIEGCNNALKEIENLMSHQIELSIDLINRIFHRLHSYESEIMWENDSFVMKNSKTEKVDSIITMSTAQKVCLALSVIFTQFFISKNAPRIILLDESVANFDYFHLLNLCDFLRDAALAGVQIFFATASDEVAQIAKNKFIFLKDDFFLYKLDKNIDLKTDIIRIP